MDVDHAYRFIQDLFHRGLVVVLGSGVSAARGLPTMGQLAEHLKREMPRTAALTGASAREEWQKVEAQLATVGLETALSLVAVSDDLADEITRQVVQAIEAREAKAIVSAMDSPDNPFGRFLSHLARADSEAQVITTNYDRLVEVHAAAVGVRVDTMFYGHTLGRLDPDLSQSELLRPSTVPGRPGRQTLARHPHLRLSKPHGSLDWIARGEQVFRSDLPLSGDRRVIAPGNSKYRKGYDTPFDVHRTRANGAIDRAQSLLFAGYGFNDEHLQTHLLTKFSTVPSLIVARTLTDSAHRYLDSSEDAVGIESAGPGESLVHYRGSQARFPGDLWDLDHLVEEVLKP